MDTETYLPDPDLESPRSTRSLALLLTVIQLVRLLDLLARLLRQKLISSIRDSHSFSGRGGAGNVAYSTDDSSTLRELDEHDESVRDSYEARGREGGLTSTGKVSSSPPTLPLQNLKLIIFPRLFLHLRRSREVRPLSFSSLFSSRLFPTRSKLTPLPISPFLLSSFVFTGAGNMHPIPDISTINLQDRGTSPHVVENGEYGRTSGSSRIPLLYLPRSPLPLPL